MASKDTAQVIEDAENQIELCQQEVDYDTREFTIEILVQKYLRDIEKDENELYVPEYQREFIWDNKRQSRFIESLILGLPIPLIFVAEIRETGKLEIVDGSQRIRTLAAFFEGDLLLTGLSNLTRLNGIKFDDMKSSRQRKLRNIPMRMIVLSSKATEKVRNDMFDRINTSSVPLAPMEKRKGVYRGAFSDFVFQCAESQDFQSLCPIGRYFQDRQEEAELALRFFGFSETYPKFTELNKIGVAKFLDSYLELKNANSNKQEIQNKKDDFFRMVSFVKRTFPFGFAKSKNAGQTARPYFEAIAIGSHLALAQNPSLNVRNIEWLSLDDKSEFYTILSSKYHTHKPSKIKQRVDFVKTQLLLSHVNE